MRKRSMLKNVCKHLMDSLASHKGIAEDQVLSFMDELSSEDPRDLLDMPPDYRKVSFFISEVWQYREWKKMSPEQAFLYGGLWGSVKSFEDRYRKNRDEDRMKLLIPKYKDKYWLFRAVKSHPGILHKELAVKGRISPSRLSQIMDDKDMDTLISYRLSGREKYYFLKPQGEELLNKLKTGERRVLGSYAEPYKAISINNDSTGYAYRRTADVVIRVNGNLLSVIGLKQRSDALNVINSDLTAKKILGVNEWTQIQDYTNGQRSSRLASGSEMSLVR